MRNFAKLKMSKISLDSEGGRGKKSKISLDSEGGRGKKSKISLDSGFHSTPEEGEYAGG